jgi:sigma-B regulation protein RsbU (phosphoserine phosphatase)
VKDSAFIKTISQVGGRPVMRDELEAGGKTTFLPDERAWFNSNRVALVLPMVTRAKLIGFLGIGSKSERSDFEPADFEILQSLGNQIAVATDNIILLEENVEKRRMEAELSIARKVQEGMLPHDIPVTPGLQVAALSRFCTEVAGDYYDVIDIGDGRTVLAIGDVSGKGAGAAMLMSNVQASLRTSVGMETTDDIADSRPPHGIDLARIVTNINRLIHRNSQPEQFITFFVAVYDPKKRTLAFANAGHNPPLAVSRSGEVRELLDGGVLLGAVADFPYQQGSAQLASGDMVFLYTDGLSESTRPDGQMFGEERIKQFLIRNVDLPPQQLLARLEEEVATFADGIHLADDFTLVVAKTD